MFLNSDLFAATRPSEGEQPYKLDFFTHLSDGRALTHCSHTTLARDMFNLQILNSSNKSSMNYGHSVQSVEQPEQSNSKLLVPLGGGRDGGGWKG